jgi:hypothetical protein
MRANEVRDNGRVKYMAPNGRIYTGVIWRRLMSSALEVWVKFDEWPPHLKHHFGADDSRHNHALMDIEDLDVVR